MKTYATIESKIVFINESDFQELFKKYESSHHSITKLETFEYIDGNIIKVELLKSRSLKNYENYLRY